jgi:hypothetical protein
MPVGTVTKCHAVSPGYTQTSELNIKGLFIKFLAALNKISDITNIQ